MQDFSYETPHAGAHTIAEGKFLVLADVEAGPSSGELKRFRISKRESQERFWSRFGVTQSSGSRFETGLAIPAPVAILVKLYLAGRLNDGDLPG